MKPYIVLGTYKPTLWKAFRVGRDICGITKAAGLIPHIDPAHGPLHGAAWFNEALHAECRRRTFKTKQAEGWHYDGDTTPGSKPNCCLVLWSSTQPTWIKWQNLNHHFEAPEYFVPKPFEVILFRNMSCLHRRPPNCVKNRWTFRQRVAVPGHLELP